MQLGVIIEQGLLNWQIVQQCNGKANINLSGKYHLPENFKESGRVFARVVGEDEGVIVIPWAECRTNDSGFWNITLEEVPAGGLYRIETCLHSGEDFRMELGIRGDMIHHIGVGDLYVVAGQSNSAGYGRDPIYDPPELGIHLYRNNGQWDIASHPMNESTNTVHEENREEINPGHSPYLSFARLLKRELGYPIGLIQSALGGTVLSAWNPEEDGYLYRSMMKSIKACGGKIKGMLWYQGCSDALKGLADTYLDRFKKMVNSLRKELNDEKLAILTVQLNRCLLPCNKEMDISWGRLREAQRKAQKMIKNVFLVPALDCRLSDQIHNSSASNLIIGERLARTALAQINMKQYIWKAPDIEDALKVGEDEVQLKFGNVSNSIYMFDIPVSNLPFTFEDEEGETAISSYEINGSNTIAFRLVRKLKGKCLVHGAYQQNPSFVLPVDTASNLPMYAFFGVEARC